ncbi:MAG: hypothetical protein D6775_07805 [Caldilineae bacterium]|nr:MAG: hypothetical protein D6775_07805 [Caldilineae bacterium]
MLPLLEEAYISTGKVYFVYKDYPVIGGDFAVIASLAGQCASNQGQFWAMNNWLFDNLATWRVSEVMDILAETAGDLGLDQDAFSACMQEQASIEPIVVDYQEGQNYGIRGTPNFVINGHLIQGLLPWEQMKAIIDALIIEAETGSLPETVATVTPSPTPDLDFAAEEVTSKGDPDAPVVIVEFSDYQCPFCLRHFRETLPSLTKDYIETGKVRYVFKDFPLSSIHPQALDAALAAECAGEQGAYWSMHDRLFGEQERWAGKSDAVDTFKAFAAELELDTEAFNRCLDERTYQDEVAADFREGVAAGVTGTPAFFINGVFVSGAQPYEVFQQVIDQQLNP